MESDKETTMTTQHRNLLPIICLAIAMIAGACGNAAEEDAGLATTGTSGAEAYSKTSADSPPSKIAVGDAYLANGDNPMASQILHHAMQVASDDLGKTYWACSQHPGGICEYTDNYADAKQKWADHKAATGHTDGGPASGTCPFEPSGDKAGTPDASHANMSAEPGSMVSPQTAKCPYELNANVLCCSVCGGCGQHLHTNCSATSLGMKGASVGNCASGNTSHNGALICSKCGFCGVHGHAH
jgi:hypothetical protein